MSVPQVRAGQLCPQGRAKEHRIPTSVKIASSFEVLFALVLKPDPLYSRELYEHVQLDTKQISIAEKEEVSSWVYRNCRQSSSRLELTPL